VADLQLGSIELVRVLAVRAVLAAPPPFFEPLDEPVVRTIAVRTDQTLEQLHEALRLAFGWADPHLYSFWVGGTHWDREAPEYTAPFEVEEMDEDKLSARTPLGELRLKKGSKLAYLFDFGDEWRLDLEVVDSWAAEDASYPMLVEAVGCLLPSTSRSTSRRTRSISTQARVPVSEPKSGARRGRLRRPGCPLEGPQERRLP
jgi:hypothetical protein